MSRVNHPPPAARRLAALLLAAAALWPGAARAQTADEQRRLAPAWVPRLAQLPRAPGPADDAGAPPAPWQAWTAAYLAANNFARGQLRMTPAEIATWDGQLRALLATLQRAPVLREPHGVRLWSSSGRLGAGAVPQALAGGLMVGAWLPEQLKTRPDGRTVIAGETSHLLVGVNEVPATPGPAWMKDEAGEFFPLLRHASPWPGTTVVGRTLLVLPPGRPEPYAPVSRERVLRAFVAAHADAERQVQQALQARRQQLEDYLGPANEPRRRADIEQATRGFMNANRQDEATARARAEAIDRAHVEQLRRAAEPPPEDPLFAELRTVRAVRDELERMPPAQRAAPAWVSAALNFPWLPLLREPGSPGALPVVQVDPAWFDRRLPRTALQLLTVERLDMIADESHSARAASGDRWTTAARVNLLVLQQTDWAALAREHLR